MDKLKKAKKLVKKAKAAVNAYQQTPDREGERKRAKAAKAKAEEYVDLYLSETHPLWVQLQQIHTQYQRVKYGPNHYYLKT